MIINGKHLKEFGMYMLEGHENPLLPSVTHKTVKIPGVPGLYDFGAEVGPKYFNIPIGFVKTDYGLMRQNAERFLHQFFDEYAQSKEVELSFDYAPERIYKAKYNGDMLLLERIVRTLGRFELPLIAYDPFSYANPLEYDKEPIEYDKNHEYDKGHMYPNYMTANWNGVVQYVGIHNHSHYITPLNVAIEGRVINPKITVNGKGFSVNVAVYENERLYIDSKTQQVWKVDIEEDFHRFLTPVMISQSSIEWERMNIFGVTDGEFPHLNSGDNSIMFSGGNPSATIELDWEHRFL